MKSSQTGAETVLLPQPQKVRRNGPDIPLPEIITISVPAELQAAAKLIKTFTDGRLCNPRTKAGSAAWINISIKQELPPQGYTLKLSSDGIKINAPDADGAWYAAQTLRQLLKANRAKAPQVYIEDFPEFPVRGVYYDVARGRIPTLAALKTMAENLSRYKINQLQLYFEHSFRFKSHPLIGKGCGGMTANEITTLDRFCLKHRIELVPSLACFGHMNKTLSLPPYRHLAEDYAAGIYSDAVAYNALAEWKKKTAWSLSPANPDSYKLLKDLFDDLLPHFSSPHFNVCCDEVFDLGMGQSHKLCRKTGRDGLFLRHVLRLRKLAAQHGRKIQIWGDMLQKYPAIISQLPSDVIILDWEYSSNVALNHPQPFAEKKRSFYVCPGTSSWVALFPRLYEAAENIRRMAQSGLKHRATGFLNTDWGDGGHYNFMEYSWAAYLVGAEAGWNINATQNTFFERFCSEFMQCQDDQLAQTLQELAALSHTSLYGYYQSVWLHVFYATPDCKLFQLHNPHGDIVRNGRIKRNVPIKWDAALGKQTCRQAQNISRNLRRLAKRRRIDPHGLLPYWIFAADSLAHAGKKLAAFGHGGKVTPAVRRQLATEMRQLMSRFSKLWMQNNRRSEIDITLRRYQNVIDALSRINT